MSDIFGELPFVPIAQPGIERVRVDEGAEEVWVEHRAVAEEFRGEGRPAESIEADVVRTAVRAGLKGRVTL